MRHRQQLRAQARRAATLQRVQLFSPARVPIQVRWTPRLTTSIQDGRPSPAPTESVLPGSSPGSGAQFGPALLEHFARRPASRGALLSEWQPALPAQIAADGQDRGRRKWVKL